MKTECKTVKTVQNWLEGHASFSQPKAFHWLVLQPPTGQDPHVSREMLQTKRKQTWTNRRAKKNTATERVTATWQSSLIGALPNKKLLISSDLLSAWHGTAWQKCDARLAPFKQQLGLRRVQHPALSGIVVGNFQTGQEIGQHRTTMDNLGSVSERILSVFISSKPLLTLALWQHISCLLHQLLKRAAPKSWTEADLSEHSLARSMGSLFAFRSPYMQLAEVDRFWSAWCLSVTWGQCVSTSWHLTSKTETGTTDGFSIPKPISTLKQ